ncbi:MAG: hypothetical protein ASARMPREDX12_007182 [Alectoria sarmentosa]|nr:MAG: hypothetical protein ASARMPREDX12_007182 [Alectoria sarmentosa]
MPPKTTDPTTTPLGTLVKLPPELRDQIYDHVLDRSYVVFWTYYHNDSHASPDGVTPTVFADLEIRSVSKALGAEAGARFFSTATTFAFLVGFHEHDRLSTPPAKTFTEKLLNVEFVVDTGAPVEGDYIRMVEEDMVFYDRDMWGEDIVPMITGGGELRGRQTIYYPATMDPRCEASVDHFTGIDVERNNFFITFKDFDPNFQLFMATRFFQTLKKCVGFRNIAVGLERWGFEASNNETVELVEKVEEVRMELEQCWGPCVVKDVLDQYTETTGEADLKLYFAFELAFQPLKFHGEKVKAGGVGATKEEDRGQEAS